MAAGILGGLIALVGAGVLQYAGVVPSIGPASTATTGRDYGGEIDALKAELQSRSTAPVDTAPLEQRIAALEQTIGATGQGDAAGLDQIRTEVEQLKSTLAEQQQAVQTSTTDLANRLGEAEKKLEEPSSDVKLARAVAVTALKTAIDKGGPYLAELDALKSVSPDDPAVAGLAESASRGVPARSDLTRDFPAIADQMLIAVRGTDPNQSVFARLYDSAASAIRVRPVGNVEGNGADAIIARIEDRLTDGDLKGASLEWDGLPKVAQDAGKDFKARLDERIRVEGLIDAAVAGGATANQG
ncbi:COG4223 family protein [Rhizobium sp. YIM 134829]|uniref:COG4223 family protein n=1 Tax=Rhizobium sp. YIM 134829 TaxID=3390453 RepID=UPI00397A778C